MPVPSPSHGTIQLAAWLRWPAPPDEGWVAKVAAFAAEHLPMAAIPTRWAAVDSFVLTERGKLDRQALPSRRTHGFHILRSSRHAHGKTDRGILVGVVRDGADRP